MCKHLLSLPGFEGSRIPHLSKVRAYRPPTEDNSAAMETENAAGEEMDNYVLQKLFRKTGESP